VAVTRQGISPMARMFAARALGDADRLGYFIALERIGAQDTSTLGDDGLVRAGERATVYVGPGGLYTAASSAVSLEAGAREHVEQVHGIYPRGTDEGERPFVGDLLTVLAAPPDALHQVDRAYTVLSIDGAGRIGPLWNLTLATLAEDTKWPVEF